MKNVKLKPLKYALAYLVIVFAVSCGVKKKYTQIEAVKSDTLIVKTETVKAPVINDTFTLKEICEDSVVTEFEKIFIRDTDTVTLRLQDNSLIVQISQQERVISEKDSVIQRQSESLKELRESVKTRPNLKLTLILLGVIALLWFVPGIPSTVNKWFRRIVLKLP